MTAEPDPYAAFGPDELARYARHFALGEVGPEGQARLREGRILLVGAGGLGSPAALYLAAAGVGTLGVIDPDRVDVSNLQRQVVHDTGAVGRLKADSAAERIEALNPHIQVRRYPERLTSANALAIVGDYDLVVDGSDNFPTRYLVNDAAVLLGKPWVYGAILRWEGQLALFGAPDGPCYRCLFREPPPPGLVPGCAEAGVVGVLPGVIGSLQALEAVKWILGRGTSMAGRLLIFDSLALSFREIVVQPDPTCPICGEDPQIHELVDYEHFCATGELRTEGEGGSDPSVETGAPAASSTSVPSLSPAELRRRLEESGGEPPLLVDVREEWEWALSNLSGRGAVHLPLDRLEAEMHSLPEGRDVVLYCRSGARSARAVELLRAAGLGRAVNLEGGLQRWAREVEPGMPVA